MQMPRTMQDPGPQMPCGVIYYKNILFLRTKITFKELGMEDLGIYSCDVTETDGIAASYLIDEEGKFKASSFTGPSCFEFSMMFYHQVTFVLIIQGLIVLFSPYRVETFTCSQPRAQVPK